MASSSSEVEKGDGAMDIGDVPVALAERLGVEAGGGLVQLFNEAREAVDDRRAEWSEQVLNLAAERFERRLVEETSKLRVEMAQGFAAVRQEMSALRAELKQEICGRTSDLRQEIGELRGELRQEIGGLRGELKQEIGGLRGELKQEIGGLEARLQKEIAASVRWSFLFWIGQVAAIAALLAFMLRGLPR